MNGKTVTTIQQNGQTTVTGPDGVSRTTNNSQGNSLQAQTSMVGQGDQTRGFASGTSRGQPGGPVNATELTSENGQTTQIRTRDEDTTNQQRSTTEPTQEPLVSTEEPAVSTQEPTVSTQEPAVSTEEPTVSTEEPTVASPQQTDAEKQSTTKQPQVSGRSSDILPGTTAAPTTKEDVRATTAPTTQKPVVQGKQQPQGSEADYEGNTQDANQHQHTRTTNGPPAGDVAAPSQSSIATPSPREATTPSPSGVVASYGKDGEVSLRLENNSTNGAR